MTFTKPELGHGAGLRAEHYSDFLASEGHAAIERLDWMEAVTENFMVRGGRPLRVLEAVRARMPVVLHGVSLCIGSISPVNPEYIARLRTLIERFEPAMVSDHLCWGSHGVHYAHDLLPLPYTEEALAHVASKVRQVQDLLGRQIMLENVSSYVAFEHSTMPEWEFLASVAQDADCGLLLDVNNVYVSAHNHGFDTRAYIDGIPVDRVGQFHLAGHEDHGDYLLDTHDHPVPDDVWALYAHAVRRFGRVAALVEWDEHVPTLERLVEECDEARRMESLALASCEHDDGDDEAQGRRFEGEAPSVAGGQP